MTTLAPQPHSVQFCAPQDFEVVPFTPQEFLTAAGHMLSHVNDHGFMDLALLIKGDRRIVRGHRRLERADVQRALTAGWDVRIIHLSVGRVQDYTVRGVSLLLSPTRAQELSHQLEAATADDSWAVLTAPYRADLHDLLCAYFAGEA